MTGTFEQIALVLSVMLIAANVSLFIGGHISSAQVPAITRVLQSFDLSNDEQTQEFQEQFLLKDSEGNSLGDTVGDSFAVQVLDFVAPFGIFGDLITYIVALVELMFTLAFGVVVIAGKMGASFGLTLLLGVVCLAIYLIGIGNYLLRVLASKGGNS